MHRRGTLLNCLLGIATFAQALAGCVEFPAQPDGERETEPSTTDPEAVQKAVTVFCSSNVTPQTGQTLPWVLTVDPAPIEAGGKFMALVEGLTTFDESFLDLAQAVVPGGVREVNILEFSARVIASSGADGPDVPLTHAPSPLCAIPNESGTREPCNPENDLEGEPGLRGNTDCSPQGQDNPCSRFVVLPISDDCSPGGECWNVGRNETATCSPNDFCRPEASMQCAGNGFCNTDTLEVPLAPQEAEFQAESGGEITFGWYPADDAGEWEFPFSTFEDPPSPISLRFFVGSIPISLDCVASTEAGFANPTRDELISFAIVDHACANGAPLCPDGFTAFRNGRCGTSVTPPGTTVQDPTGGACDSRPTDLDLFTDIPFSDVALLSSPSLEVSATVRSSNVFDEDCVPANDLIAGVGYQGTNGNGISSDGLVFNDSSAVSISFSDPGVRSVWIQLVPELTWTVGDDRCCERTFETTWSASVAQCEER
ncbi:MAG: hypothetical protein AAF436_20055 [Myxococcota bacterium]